MGVETRTRVRWARTVTPSSQAGFPRPSLAHAGGFAAVVYTDLLHAGFVVLGSVLLMGYGK